MGYGGGVILQLLILGDDDGASSLIDEGGGEILDWCGDIGGCGHRPRGDIGCGGFEEPGCLHRKKGYPGGCLPPVQDALRCAVHRLCQTAGDGLLGAARMLGGAAGDGHQKYDGHSGGECDVIVLHGLYDLLQM